MKRKLKSLLSVMTAASLTALLTINAFSEKKTPCVTLKGGYAAENNITTVTASIDTELDLAAYSISLSYDPSMLEFTDAHCSTEYGSFYPGDSADDHVTLVWSDSHNRTLSGELFTVEFKTKSRTAETVIPINIGYSVLGNSSSEEIPFDARGCEITVMEDYKWGDTNCDGKISMSDAALTAMYNINSKIYPLSENQYINSDTDGNNVINSKDVYAILNHVITAKEEF